MSGDNYRPCPWCWEQSKERIEDETKDLENRYGKIPAEQYDRERDALAARMEELPGATLREDYEFYFEGGHPFILKVNYGCHCPECGNEFSFRAELDIRKPAAGGAR